MLPPFFSSQPQLVYQCLEQDQQILRIVAAQLDERMPLGALFPQAKAGGDAGAVEMGQQVERKLHLEGRRLGPATRCPARAARGARIRRRRHHEQVTDWPRPSLTAADARLDFARGGKSFPREVGRGRWNWAMEVLGTLAP